jgi:Icc-related predicted phosphoesterase
VKALVFSDIHNDYRALERLAAIEADYYIAAGDLVSWERGLDRCGEILKPRAERVYVLPGNHESHEVISQFCRRYGFHDFHGVHVRAGEFFLAGLGYSNPTPFNTPGEYSEAEIERRLAPFGGLQPLVLVCHCPPLGTPLDRVREGVHAGSRAVREFVEKHRPAAFFCGHIHEAAGVEIELGSTLAVNAGPRGYLLDFAKLKAR